MNKLHLISTVLMPIKGAKKVKACTISICHIMKTSYVINLSYNGSFNNSWWLPPIFICWCAVVFGKWLQFSTIKKTNTPSPKPKTTKPPKNTNNKTTTKTNPNSWCKPLFLFLSYNTFGFMSKQIGWNKKWPSIYIYIYEE